MVAGHLQKKCGYWYVVVTYSDDGKPKAKWISTGLKIKNNKRKAEQILQQKRLEVTMQLNKNSEALLSSDEKTFSWLVKKWLTHKKSQIRETTYIGYMVAYRNHIAPYIELHPCLAKDVDAGYVQQYIDWLYAKGLSHKSVNNHRGILSNIFRYGVMLDVMDINPITKLEPPRKPPIIENYYSRENMLKLMESCKDTQLEYPVMLACTYGLRRGEICGIKWNAIDFDNDYFIIKHTVVSVTRPGGRILLGEDVTKNKKPKSFPLIDGIKKMLLKIKKRQETLGIYDSDGYIYIKNDGMQIHPDYITESFRNHLKKHELPLIRFHDLRHSCASLLIADPERSVTLKDVQLWLGHTDIKSTLRYAHLSDIASKSQTAKFVEHAIWDKLQPK